MLISKANSANSSYKITIPMFAMKQLNLKEGDNLIAKLEKNKIIYEKGE